MEKKPTLVLMSAEDYSKTAKEAGYPFLLKPGELGAWLEAFQGENQLVYVVDNDPDNCRLIIVLLTLKHAECTSFTSAQALLGALNQTNTKLPDFIISDYRLDKNGPNGLQLLQLITQLPRFNSNPAASNS